MTLLSSAAVKPYKEPSTAQVRADYGTHDIGITLCVLEQHSLKRGNVMPVQNENR